MAINIYSEPEVNETSSPYRPTFVDCSSDTGTIVRIIADVYVLGGLVATVEKEPIIGTTDQFRIEVGEVQKKYLESEFETTSSFLESHACLTSANYFQIKLFEVTESGGVLTTAWLEDGAGSHDAASNQLYQFNGVNQHLQTIESRLCDGVTKQFLTNRPELSNIARSGIYHCGILPNTEGYRAKIQVEEYSGLNGTGSLLADNTSAVNPSPSYRKVNFTVDTDQLNASTKSIIYRAKDNSGVIITEDVTQNIVDVCNVDTVHLFFQNHWGAIDQYYFSGNKIQKTKNRTKSITNRLDLEYDSTDRGKRDIRKTNSRVFEIFTNTTNPAVVEWLAEIGESVDVSIMVGTDRIPINVLSVTSEIENLDDVSVQMTVKYTLANERINQLG